MIFSVTALRKGQPLFFAFPLGKAMNTAVYGGTPFEDQVPLTQPLDFDLLVLAELLTFFVVSQLAAHHVSDEWFEVEDLARSAKLWRQRNGYKLSRLQVMTVGRRAQGLAARVQRMSQTTFDETATASMSFDGLHIDFRSSTVVEIFLTCANDLSG
jgi:hypothetical protein